MTNEYSPLSALSLSAAAKRGRSLSYFAAIVAANAVIWGIVLFLLKGLPRVYTSQWSVIILEGGKTGAASVRDKSIPNAPSSERQDLKVSYRVIATNDSVRKAAASKVGMTTEQFGIPRVSPVDGTALLDFEISGSTRQEAQKKAYAVHEAFEERLNQLRVQQAEEQEAGFENSLGVSRKKLEAAQLRLSDYKVKAGLASKDQIDQLANSIETLRRQRAEIVAQQQDANTRTRQLTTNLNISSRSAAEAFTLQADSLFQQYVKEYNEATANLTNLSTKFGENHPVVVRESARQEAARVALQDRGQVLLGRPIDESAIARLNLINTTAGGSAREGLYKDLVTNETERQGLAVRVQELDRQIYQLEQRLSILAQRSSTLDALNRDMQIAEAVFSARLSGIDSSASTSFGAYPAIQMIAEPSLSEQGVVPQQRTFIWFAAIASTLTTTTLLFLWLRKKEPFQQWLQQFHRA